jgi:predicted nucleic acid-binding protein
MGCGAGELRGSLWIDFTRARSPARRSQAVGGPVRHPGWTAASLDLLVAAVALHHNAVLVSFDADFEAIASVSEMRLKRLQRPG